MKQRNVLVVDDEADFASFVKEVSMGMGDVAETCHSTKDARILLDSYQPDVLVLDIVMPDEDGIEFLRWLGEQSHRPRVILTTGYNPDYAKAAEAFGELAGFDIGVILKPVPIAALREVLA